MRLRPRLLHVVIASAGLLLALKLGSVWFAIDAQAATAFAQTPAPAQATMPGRMAAAEPAPKDPIFMSPSEVEVLQKLSERRSELDRRESAMEQRDVILRATEKRIDEKIAKLQALEKGIGETVKKQDDEDDNRIKSLVRIYENMKPREAARVFEQIETPVLLGLVEKMRELKTAPILASMDPEKAKQLTLALAERRNQAATAQATAAAQGGAPPANRPAPGSQAAQAQPAAPAAAPGTARP